MTADPASASTFRLGSLLAPRNFAIALVIAYLWWLLTTPYLSNRFSFLATIRFERVLAGALAATLLLGSYVYPRGGAGAKLVVLFLLWTMIAFMCSPYQDSSAAQQWLDQYWKHVLVYYFILYAIRDLDDLKKIVCAIVLISLCYQLYSWFDFLRGGSYVWQQGMKRMVGTWSGGGIGAANAWGVTCMFTLPFGLAWYSCTGSKRIRRLCLFFVILSLLSIVFSGTRGAVVVVGSYFVFCFRRWIFSLKGFSAFAIVLAAAFLMLPESYRHRYFDLMSTSEHATETKSDQLAISSAQARIDGLKHGWMLFLERPVLGYGPGASASARANLVGFGSRYDGRDLQLHNLYGQVLSETGLVGTSLFLAILVTYFRELRAITPDGVADVDSARWIIELRRVLIHLGWVLIAYGMFGHILYRYYWLLIFALQGALVFLWRKESSIASTSFLQQEEED